VAPAAIGLRLPRGRYGIVLDSIERLYSVDELEQIPDPPGGRYELHHGELYFKHFRERRYGDIQRALRDHLDPFASRSVSLRTPTTHTVPCRKANRGARTSPAFGGRVSAVSRSGSSGRRNS
jgi:hypothetical protein